LRVDIGGCRRRMRMGSGSGCGPVMPPNRQLVRWGSRPGRSALISCGACGGIRPVPRRRSPGRLSLSEREEISRGLAASLSLRAIAAGLGRAPSTVSREVAAHGARGQYRAAPADQVAWARARRWKVCKLATHPALRAIVGEKLKQEWSPQGTPAPARVCAASFRQRSAERPSSTKGAFNWIFRLFHRIWKCPTWTAQVCRCRYPTV
jgi:hypothetical protein